MIELYQELVPFTNDKSNYSASQSNTYSNPILMPLSLDVTSTYNVVETVIYVRNNDKDKYYENVFVCLLAPKSQLSDTQKANDTYTITSIPYDYDNGIINLYASTTNKFSVDTEYCAETVPSGSISLEVSTYDDGTGASVLLPVSGVTGCNLASLTPVKDVRFSYGYDEVSELGWQSKSHSLIIPNIGNAALTDTSYIPVRMRIYLNNNYGDLITLRDYSINISYSLEGSITA